MRVLQFPSVEIYNILFEGLHAVELKGPYIRTLNKVITKLEEIGTPRIIKGEPHPILYTMAENKPVMIEDAHYDLMKATLNNVDWQTKNIKLIDQMLEFVDNAPTEEEFEARKVGVLELSNREA